MALSDVDLFSPSGGASSSDTYSKPDVPPDMLTCGRGGKLVMALAKATSPGCRRRVEAPVPITVRPATA